jgi:hypothetical protein
MIMIGTRRNLLKFSNVSYELRNGPVKYQVALDAAETEVYLGRKGHLLSLTSLEEVAFIHTFLMNASNTSTSIVTSLKRPTGSATTAPYEWTSGPMKGSSSSLINVTASGTYECVIYDKQDGLFRNAPCPNVSFGFIIKYEEGIYQYFSNYHVLRHGLFNYACVNSIIDLSLCKTRCIIDRRIKHHHAILIVM